MAEMRPVLIAGAGPTGLTAAMELERMGIPVRLVDKAEGPSTTSRALAIQARTVELLRQRGLAEPMLAKGNVARGVTLYDDGQPAAHIDLGRIESRFQGILLLSQAETEEILRDHLAGHGVPVEFKTELIAFAQQGDAAHASQGGVTVTLRKPDGSLEEVDAAYLICSEGAHSNVRQTLGLKFPGKSLEHTYVVGDQYMDSALPQNEVTIFLGKGGLLAVFPMGAGRFRIISSRHDDPLPADAPAPTLEELQRMWDAGASVPARLYDLKWSSRFRINSRVVERMQVGRVFLGGDSAHVHSPAGGQGMNTGMQDMINLCWKLAMVSRGWADRKLLDTYETERLPVVHGVVQTTERVTDAAQQQDHTMYAMAAHLAFLALHTGAVRSEAAHIVSQTAYSYAKGPLAHGAPGAGRLQVGDRVPEVELATGAWLQSLLDPSRFTLLVLQPQAAAAGSDLDGFGNLVSVVPAEAARSVFGDAVRYALVRPDGHLACAATELGAVAGWLRHWFSERKPS